MPLLHHPKSLDCLPDDVITLKAPTTENHPCRFNLLGKPNLFVACQQRDRPHLCQIHTNGIIHPLGARIARDRLIEVLLNTLLVHPPRFFDILFRLLDLFGIHRTQTIGIVRRVESIACCFPAPKVLTTRDRHRTELIDQEPDRL